MDKQAVIVRTYSAGVHFGYFVNRHGKDVTLERSRRIWSWRGANTCSELAATGPDFANSRIAMPVNITLTEAIEIIEVSPEVAAKYDAATWAA